jgi:hypothetical protein
MAVGAAVAAGELALQAAISPQVATAQRSELMFRIAIPF